MQSDPRMIWRKLRPAIKGRCTFSEIKDLVATAGLPIEKLHHLQQRSLPARSASKQELLDAIDGLIAQEASPDDAIEKVLNALQSMKPQLFEVDSETETSATVSDLLSAIIGRPIQPESKISPDPHLFTPSQHSLEVFVSHSSKDSDVAEVLIDLLRAALEVPASAIRCTSVDGYRLAAGASTDEALQREVRDCKCFIAILTADSLRSSYVLFELGARWGARQPLVPLLAKGLTAHSLERPLSSLNALSCSGSAQIHQLVQDVGRIISRTSVSPAVFDKHVQSLLSFGPQKTASSDVCEADENKIITPQSTNR